MDSIFSRLSFGPEPLWPLEIREDRSTHPPGVWEIACVAIFFGILSVAGRLISTNSHHIGAFFFADGFLAAFLITRPRQHWWRFLAPAWLADAISVVLIGGTPVMSGYIALCNVLEVLLAAWLVRRTSGRELDLAAPGTMFRFLIYAILAAPAASGVMACLYYHLVFGTPFWQVYWKWFPAYALGMAVMAPLTFCAWNPRLKELFSPGQWLRTTAVFLLVLVVALAVFAHPSYPTRFLWLPLLMLVVFELGLPGAVIAIFETVAIATLYTLHGMGPFWAGPDATFRHSVTLLQMAIFALVISILPFAAALERQRQLRAKLRLGMKHYRLLADHSRDIVVLINLEGRRMYASPAVQDVLGWTPEEWIGKDAADFMHKEDIAAFEQILKGMLKGEGQCTFRYRTRHKDGRYLWMEASLRALPDEITGEPNGFVANVRDVSERVDAEQKLAEAHAQLQQQAERDSLTQLANRRCLDRALEREWRRTRRTRNPLALLMIDIDHFKRINDTYGHRVGDRCLQAMASLLQQVARRPSDVAARYGGEEFAILLPDVGLQDATVIADGLCVKVREHSFEVGLDHPLTLTVSIGVAARIPEAGRRADSLVDTADLALYAAKQAGRDRVIPEFDGIGAAQLMR